MMNFIIVALFLTFYTSGYLSAGENNYVSIQIEEMDYKLPEGSKGVGGTLVFPRVKMNWDGLKLSLKNKNSFLDSEIKVRPTYLRFQTPGIGISVPIESISPFFEIDNMKLISSKIMLNQDFFNFDGELFEVSDGINTLTLDKFNMFCTADGKVNMTGLDGLIEGCLTDFVLNGKEENDLAGAKLEYFGEAETSEEDAIYLESRLKEFTLKDSNFNLSLNHANLKAGGYDVDLGATNLRCQKYNSLVTLDIDELRNGCVDSMSVDSPKIIVKNVVEKSEYAIKMESMVTTQDRFQTILKNVAMKDIDSLIELRKIQIDCKKYEHDEFYDLHKVIRGCIEDSTIKIENIVSTSKSIEKKNENFWDSWFETEADESIHKYAHTLKAIINGKLMDFVVTIKLPYVPEFNIEVDAYITHINTEHEKYLEFRLVDVYVAKVPTWRWGINKLADFFLEQDDFQFEGKTIKVKL